MVAGSSVAGARSVGARPTSSIFVSMFSKLRVNLSRRALGVSTWTLAGLACGEGFRTVMTLLRRGAAPGCVRKWAMSAVWKFAEQSQGTSYQATKSLRSETDFSGCRS